MILPATTLLHGRTFLVFFCLVVVLAGQSPSSGGSQSVGDDIFFLDLGIVIEPGTGKEEVNRLIKAPPEKVNFFLDKEPAGSVFMASTREMQKTLTRISERIDALENAFHEEMGSVRKDNKELRDMVADLLTREPLIPSPPASPLVSSTVPTLPGVEKPEGSDESDLSDQSDQSDQPDLASGEPVLAFNKMGYMNAVFAYQREDYRAALDHFLRLYIQGQDHTTWGNVLYWISDCYYRLGDYRKALDTLGELRPLVRSDKQDDALVLTGLVHRQMGHEIQALEAFDHIVQHYPDSEYFKLASMELRKSQQ